jgi:signal transduction histidine kinase
MGCPASAFAEDRSGLVELTHPQDRERVREEIRAAVHAGAVYRTIFRLRDVAGREKWVWEQGRAVHAADGSVAALEGFITDVTERKRAEEVLRNQQRWLERLLDLAPSPMLLVELGSGRVIFVNRAGEALTDGLRPMREVAGGEDPDFYYTEAEGRRVAPDELPAALAAQGERLEALQLDWHTPAGTRSLLVSSDVLPATAGHTATAILVLQDVTALKRIEAELRAAHRVKDEFLATLSHELRTPLSPILGWAGMMRSERLDPATRTRGVEAILRNATLQARLVDDLLDVSAIVSGKIRLHLQPVDLAEIVREATDAIRPAAMAKRIQLEVAPGPGDVRVSADPDRLRQVVSNLLSNAVKFTPTGGAVTAALDSAPGAIELVVRDTGEGISPEFLPHVFERFRQADSTTTRRYGGLGIGLALVRHLVEMHGGSVRAESEGPGRGSAFRVRLPALAPVLPAKRPAPDAAPPAETGEGLLAGVRVLAVEDDPDTLELLSAVLGRAGATVRCASSGAAALNDLEAWRPDLLVVDIGMPEMDGYRLLARVRDLERGAGGVIPALAVTAYTGDVSRERIMAAGFQDHLPKPLDPMELVRHAARLARRTGAGA